MRGSQNRSFEVTLNCLRVLKAYFSQILEAEQSLPMQEIKAAKLLDQGLHNCLFSESQTATSEHIGLALDILTLIARQNPQDVKDEFVKKAFELCSNQSDLKTQASSIKLLKNLLSDDVGCSIVL